MAYLAQLYAAAADDQPQASTTSRQSLASARARVRAARPGARRRRAPGRLPARRARGGDRVPATSSFGYERRPPGAARRLVRGRARAPARHRRPDRRRQDDAREPADRASTTRPRARSCSTASTSATTALADLRSQFAIVLQEPVLFSTSIAENIAYAPARGERRRDRRGRAGGRTRTTSSRALPDGYDTLVGERGHAALGRRAPADLAGARVPEGRADPDPRRADELRRRRDRGAIMDAMERLMAGPDDVHDRAPAVDARRAATCGSRSSDGRIVVRDAHPTRRALAARAPGGEAAGPRAMAASWLRDRRHGLIAQHPRLGGVAWDYVQYPLGLAGSATTSTTSRTRASGRTASTGAPTRRAGSPATRGERRAPRAR